MKLNISSSWMKLLARSKTPTRENVRLMRCGKISVAGVRMVLPTKTISFVVSQRRLTTTQDSLNSSLMLPLPLPPSPPRPRVSPRSRAGQMITSKKFWILLTVFSKNLTTIAAALSMRSNTEGSSRNWLETFRTLKIEIVLLKDCKMTGKTNTKSMESQMKVNYCMASHGSLTPTISSEKSSPEPPELPNPHNNECESKRGCGRQALLRTQTTSRTSSTLSWEVHRRRDRLLRLITTDRPDLLRYFGLPRGRILPALS